ncbi:MAG: hypothetical protein FD188_807 [Ignavibacteria bacterium]|nr:MAG: hypothetical protein FD188_807 [Ignavibacteria bacterium]
MKTKVLITVVVTLFTMLVFSCKEEQVPTENTDPRLLRVIGKYEASKYFLSDPVDRPVDILKLGGSITAEIKKDMTVSGRIIIPKTFYSDYSGTDLLYSGTFEFKGNDSIRFFTNGSLARLPFRIYEDSLKAEALTIGYFAVTLKK